MLEPHGKIRFPQLVLPHLDGAFNLACWLLLDCADGEEMLQRRCWKLAALFTVFMAMMARVWFLRFVHQTCYGWLEKNHQLESLPEFEQGLHPKHAPTAGRMTALIYDRQQVLGALESLPVRFREIILLREVEGCSYEQIAEITGIPAGSVKSALCQAREQLQKSLPALAAAKEA